MCFFFNLIFLGSRTIFEGLKNEFKYSTLDVVPLSEKKNMEISDTDLWLKRFIIALCLFVPTIVSAFIFMQIDYVRKIYMSAIFRGNQYTNFKNQN